MNPRKTKEIREALEKKGFVPSNRDHVYLFLHVDGKKSSVRTKLSHGIREYGAQLLSLMAKQLRLTNGELEQLLDCPLTHVAYVELLNERGHLGS